MADVRLQKVLTDPAKRKPFERATRKNGKTVYNTIIAGYLAEHE